MAAALPHLNMLFDGDCEVLHVASIYAHRIDSGVKDRMLLLSAGDCSCLATCARDLAQARFPRCRPTFDLTISSSHRSMGLYGNAERHPLGVAQIAELGLVLAPAVGEDGVRRQCRGSRTGGPP